MLEEAYESARQLYASDKSPLTSSAMFWTASDILRKRVQEGNTEEATKILKAIRRMLPNVPDKEGWVSDAYKKCCRLLHEDDSMPSHDRLDADHNKMGVWGEEIAAVYLRDKGYIILERDWHSGHRDIDIIARQGDCLVFVEVKTRRNNEFGSPAQAVNYQKQRNLRKAINHYLQYRRIEMPWRFDVITVVGVPPNEPEIEHVEDFPLSHW